MTKQERFEQLEYYIDHYDYSRINTGRLQAAIEDFEEMKKSYPEEYLLWKIKKGIEK